MVRLIASIAMIAMLIAILYYLHITFALIFMTLATFQGILEISKANTNDILQKNKYIIAVLGSLTPIFIYIGNFTQLLAMVSFIFIVFLYLKNHAKMTIFDVSFAMATILVFPQALNSIAKIFFLENGEFLILIPMITAWGSDVFAYLAGRTFGKNKLAPQISPNKTVEGSVGGIIGGIIGMFIFGYFTSSFIEISPVMLGIIGGFGAILGQMGDLFFSVIKRQSGIKDFSNLIPGHGGILDRFDSVLFTAPLTYAFLTMI